MVKIEIEYTGGLHSEAVHTQSGTKLQTDAPLDNGGRGESFSPTDLVATALGTCMTTTMDLYAKRNGFNIDGTKAVVVKHMTSTARSPDRKTGSRCHRPSSGESSAARNARKGSFELPRTKESQS